MQRDERRQRRGRGSGHQPGLAGRQPRGALARRDVLRRRRLARRDHGVDRISGGDGGEHVARGRRALGRIAAQTARDRLVQRGGTVVAHHLRQHEAERVQVRLARGGARLELLRRHVGGGTAEARLVAGAMRDAEVGDAGPASTVDHHIGRLEVAVRQPPLVNRVKPAAQIARHVQRLRVRQPADAPQERLQILAVDVLHDDGRAGLEVDDVVKPADVRMGDLAAGAHLAQRLFGGRDELERHGVTELEVVGAVDLPHSAAAERRDDTESSPHHGAGNELGLASHRQLEQARRALPVQR